MRGASSLDAPFIDRLLRQLAALEGTSGDIAYTLVEMEEAFDRGYLRAFVAVVDGRIVGCLTLTWDFAIWSGGKVLRIDDLIVDESWRAKGIGTALMRAAAALALSQRASMRWEVEVSNEAAQRFYRGMGVKLKDKIVARWGAEEMSAFVALP